MRRLAVRAPKLEIFANSFVLRDDRGWCITESGRQFLASLESPIPARAEEQEQPSGPRVTVVTAPSQVQPTLRLVVDNTRISQSGLGPDETRRSACFPFLREPEAQRAVCRSALLPSSPDRDAADIFCFGRLGTVSTPFLNAAETVSSSTSSGGMRRRRILIPPFGGSIPPAPASHSCIRPGFPGDARMGRKSGLFAHLILSLETQIRKSGTEIDESLRPFLQIFPFRGEFRRRQVRSPLPPRRPQSFFPQLGRSGEPPGW